MNVNFLICAFYKSLPFFSTLHVCAYIGPHHEYLEMDKYSFVLFCVSANQNHFKMKGKKILGLGLHDCVCRSGLWHGFKK